MKLIFIKNVGVVLRKATKFETWKYGLKLKEKKNISDRKAPDREVVGPKSLHIQDLRIHGSSIGRISFSFWSFNFWLPPDFHQKMLKKCKK